MAEVELEKTVDPSTEVVAGSRTRALLVGVLTSLIHFGGLVVLDLILQPAPPRIYSFMASTMGNGIFLPVANAGWYLLRAHLPRSRVGIAVGLTVGLLAGAAMLFSQLIFIVDPQPYDTWKLTEAYQFTAMGIYNTVMSTVVFTIGGYWLGDALGRLHSARWKGVDLRKGSRIRNYATLLSVLALASYGVLTVTDNLEHADTASSQAALFLNFLLFGAVALIIWLIRGDNRPLHSK